MTEEQKKPEQAEQEQEKRPYQATADAWVEVGKQFEALGKSLAAAARASWEDETNRRYLQEMQSGLESAAHDMEKAFKSGAAAMDDEKVKSKFKDAAESMRAAGEQTLEDTRPYLTYGLRQTREGLQKLIDLLERDLEDVKPSAEGEK